MDEVIDDDAQGSANHPRLLPACQVRMWEARLPLRAQGTARARREAALLLLGVLAGAPRVLQEAWLSDGHQGRQADGDAFHIGRGPEPRLHSRQRLARWSHCSLSAMRRLRRSVIRAVFFSKICPKVFGENCQSQS